VERTNLSLTVLIEGKDDILFLAFQRLRDNFAPAFCGFRMCNFASQLISIGLLLTPALESIFVRHKI